MNDLTTAPSLGTGTDPGTDPGTGAADDAIAARRRRIDEIDQEIIALVRRRVRVSAEIQQARLAAGGRRLELSREMEVIARYREALGRPGTDVAMSLLDLCRGPA